MFDHERQPSEDEIAHEPAAGRGHDPHDEKPEDIEPPPPAHLHARKRESDDAHAVKDSDEVSGVQVHRDKPTPARSLDQPAPLCAKRRLWLVDRRRIALAVGAWDVAWRLMAVRRAIRNRQYGWVALLAVTSSAGVLPMLYLWRFSRPRHPE